MSVISLNLGGGGGNGFTTIGNHQDGNGETGGGGGGGGGGGAGCEGLFPITLIPYRFSIRIKFNFERN